MTLEVQAVNSYVIRSCNGVSHLYGYDCVCVCVCTYTPAHTEIYPETLCMNVYFHQSALPFWCCFSRPRNLVYFYCQIQRFLGATGMTRSEFAKECIVCIVRTRISILDVYSRRRHRDSVASQKLTVAV